MKKKERYEAFVSYFSKHELEPVTELNYSNPFELLVAVILSAQCTDKRVNLVCPPLFLRFPEAESMAASSVEEIFSFIRSISYPNNKAKHLLGMAKMLTSQFNSIVPSDVNELQKLPGVGRKTANVIVSVIYEQPAMAVDTHVFRVANRLGLTKSKTPLATELELVKNIPVEKIRFAHHWLILHGRYVCTARSPKCTECGLKECCQYYNTVVLKKLSAKTPVEAVKF